LTAVVLIFLATAPSCIVADSLVTVKGTIVNPRDAVSTCKMRLHSARTGKPFKELEIPLEFEDGFTVAPKKLKYFLSIECTGCKEYKSPTIITKTGKTEVDLGEILLEKEEKHR
jgi:hypothetical protein